MAYAEILVGRDGKVRMTLDGMPYDPDEHRMEHMVRENWSHESSYDYGTRVIRSEHRWEELDDIFDTWIKPLGSDVIVYKKILSVSNETPDTDRFYYAYGDTKARIECEFNERVAPVIMRDAPYAMPKRGKLHTYGILDPKVDDFAWPVNMKNETPPCIEIQRTYRKTMPIEALIPPIAARGKVMFACQMRYSPAGDLVRADCHIMRREDYNVRVSFRGKGEGRVIPAK